MLGGWRERRESGLEGGVGKKKTSATWQVHEKLALVERGEGD
jgi:hypothetical protein